MIIILEGNECNFKSTIATKLSKELNLKYIKGSSFETAKCNSAELMNHYDELFSIKNDCIFDRSFYSNLVYADIYQDYTMLNQEQIRELEDVIKSNHDKILIVYLYGHLKDIKKRLNERGDDYVTKDKLQSIEARYQYIMHYFVDFPILNINTSRHSSNDICEIIKEELSYE